MAVAGSIYGGCLPSTHRNSSPKMSTQKRPPPLFVSTDPTHVNPLHLRDLYSLCNHSCHRFPILDPAGRVEPVELDKLRVAVSNSSLVVSVFANPDELYSSSNMTGVGGNWLRRLVPVTPFNGRLVGFGRAISDFGLTASIYDVMVMPTLQGRGIGRMIVQRLIRLLTNRGIYDVAGLCSDKERLFFKACGFGDDILGSTTMMYTRSGSTSPRADQTVRCAGRKLLLVPPLREPFQT